MRGQLEDRLSAADAAVETDPGEEAVTLAEKLLRESLAATTPAEAASMARVARLVESPRAKALSMLMTDRLARSSDPVRAAQAWRSILSQIGIGEGFGWWDRLQLRAGYFASMLLPGLVMGAVRRRLRAESHGVILSAEEPDLTSFLRKRGREGTPVMLNQLGEAVLGEEEARRRLDALLWLLQRPDVKYVSVKISAIFSQINLVAREATVTAINERMRRLYRAARPRGKFVNFDMEEYRDLALTVEAFTGVLDEEEFRNFSAGLVLQAYLPDSIAVQTELTAWARRRVAAGGAPIKVRLVKGANLAMERVEAEMHGWNPAPHRSKHDTDAGFRRMLEFACQPENAAAVRLGIGSHNLFDVALALVLARRHGVTDAIDIEMLEGMAPPQARAVRGEAPELQMYAPIVKESDFGSALAYLIRRLDENTSPGNFLASLFSLNPGSAAWNEQKEKFLAGWRHRKTVNDASRRSVTPTPAGDQDFSNEPDSDWTQPRYQEALARAQAPGEAPPRANAKEVEIALDRAVAAQADWAALGPDPRGAILRRCAEQLAATRYESIQLMREEGKKAIAEADTEVSEAIDFARYYAHAGRLPAGVGAEPLGTVVVAPPWNFPFAIPCGGVLAALMAGNTVILKPASPTAHVAHWLARQLWEAGVPQGALQFVFPVDHPAARPLIVDERVDAVVLTGSIETARMFQGWRPSLRLFAETSGKNAIIISALADTELAVKDLVKSAFGHAGQKCSAASLAIVEAGVYDDPVFRRQLRDAAASLAVGPATDPASIVTPLVTGPEEKLRRALTTLDEGEEWLLQPEVSPSDPMLWSPGIKLGVRRGSWFHCTECFGPVLGLMRAVDLDEAIAIQNEVEYGLTAGLHSLDEAEIAHWKERVQAGNLYINRGITGAIVRRQPFGGWKLSSIGPGAKAGGPNYVNLLRRFADDAEVTTEVAAADYRKAWREHFGFGHDPSGLRCESNVFRYRPCRGVILRLRGRNERAEKLATLAAEICGTRLTISRASEETDEHLAARIPRMIPAAEFLRTIDGPPSDALLRAVHESNLNWIDAPVSACGRLELTRWLREQVVTETMHRYGNDLAGRTTS